MSRVTENFTFDELDSNGEECPRELIPNAVRVATEAQKLRTMIGVPFFVNSWWRSEAYNATLPGAASDSMHTEALAMDIWSDELEPEELYAMFEGAIEAGIIPDGGLGIYNGHIHYDLGPAGRRWDERG